MAQRKPPEAVVNYATLLKKAIPQVKKVILFGSYAKGTDNEDSDLDVAVIVGTVADTFEMQVDLMKLRRKFDTRIEPHPIREMDFHSANPIAREVMESGIEL
ncbi:MAG: nucleotidyltransferase domain-containing protein [Desulfosoma sp.]